MLDGWGYNSGIAAGLCGLSNDADEMFSRVIGNFAPDSFLVQDTVEMARLLDDPQGFRGRVAAQVVKRRAALRLPTMATIPF